MKKNNLKKKLMTMALATSLGVNLIPLSVDAAYEYTVLGVSTFENLNNLDNDDAYMFRDKMDNHSWTRTAEWYDRNVWHTDMTKYGNESDILYITSHGGSSGTISLSERYDNNPDNEYRQFINYNQVDTDTGYYANGNLLGGPDGAGQDAEWFIFASCDSLAQKYWAEQVSNRVHHLLGYRDDSSEAYDEEVISQFIARGFGESWRSPETVWSSWINANRAYSQYNWAIIGHENNRMDYFHGVETGLTADQTSNSDVVRWYGGGTSNVYKESLSSYTKSSDEVTDVSKQEMKQLKDKFGYKFVTKKENLNKKKIVKNLLGEVEKSGFDKETQSHISSSVNGTFEVKKDGSILFSREIQTNEIKKTQDEVLKEVKEFIEQNGGMREDLALSTVLPMQFETQDGTIKTMGYTITFKQTLDETIIDSDIKNGITVGYDANGVNFYLRDVNEVVAKAKVNTNALVKPNVAIKKANEVRGIFKTQNTPIAKELSLVHYSQPFNNGEDLVPAYKVNMGGQNNVFVDALTGEVLSREKETYQNKEESVVIDKESHIVDYFDIEE